MKTLTQFIKESEEKAEEYVFAVKDDTGAIMCMGTTEDEAKEMAKDFETKEGVKTTIEKVKKSEVETK